MAENTKPSGGWSQIYNSIVQQSIIGIVLCDTDGAILECNPAFSRMLGYDNDELLFKTVEQLTHPDDWNKEASSFFQSISPPDSSSHYCVEKRYFHKDGHIVWGKVHATTIRGTHNMPVFGFAIVEDITEIKQAEDSLRRSEARYRSLFSEMTSGFALHEIILDKDKNPVDYRYLDVNPAFETMTGLKRGDVIGKTVRQVIPSIEPIWITRYGSVALTGISATFENSVDALQKHFSVHAYSPKAGQFAVISTDITDRTLAQQQLAAEKERLNVTLRSIGDGVIATDIDGKVVLVNKIIEHWLEQSQQELAGCPISNVLPLMEAHGQSSCTKTITTAVQQRKRFETRAPLRLIVGDRIDLWVTVTGSPIYDPGSNPIGMVFALKNVTEHMRAETERIKNEKLDSLGHLAAGIAHDFNNILTAILGNVTLAKTNASSTSEIATLMADAEAAIHQAHHLTQQLLTFAKGGAPIKETVNAETLIRETAEFVLHGSTSKLVFRIPSSLWHIRADIHQIAQVVRSLVINANQAMPGGGLVKITAENLLVDDDDILPLQPGHFIKISVSDSGVGISDSHIDKIFDPYFTTKQHGSGMGLATTLSIIKNHGGHIAVESRLGIGTTFEIYLPALHSSADSILPAKTHSCLINKTKILVMDDEEAIRSLTSRILIHNGCEVITTATGEEAIAAYESALASNQPFDVVILDLTIRGGMGGKDAMQKLREINPSIKAIVSSGYSNDPVMANYRKYGFRGIVPKPYQASDLIQAVAELVQPKTCC
jgi:PAS domain S-box-containing protein